jgi:hypothetical protein
LAEHRASPGDLEAMVSQGVVAKHSEEHLGTTDKGIVMLRRFLKNQIDAMARGEDPVGLSFHPETPPVYFDAGNFLLG